MARQSLQTARLGHMDPSPPAERKSGRAVKPNVRLREIHHPDSAALAAEAPGAVRGTLC